MVIARAYVSELKRLTGRQLGAAHLRASFVQAADQIVCPPEEFEAYASALMREFFSMPDKELRERGYPPGWFGYRLHHLVILDQRTRAQIERVRAEDARRRAEEAERARVDFEHNARAAEMVIAAMKGAR